MKQNNEKFNNTMNKFVGVLDKYAFMGQGNTSVLSKDKVSR